MKYYALFFFCFTVLNVFSQEKKFIDWLPQEIEYYKNLMGLAEYINGKDKADISRDTLLKKYIYTTMDTLKYKGTIYDMANFDTIFSLIPQGIKKYGGIEKLDAKPIRFYKDHVLYSPFKRSLKDAVPFVLAYYRKDRPDIPLGTLLFDPKTHKLSSWILISQGGGGWYYF